jgi:hypothetical protein
VRPRSNLALFRGARARFSRITPAWSRWIASGRIGIMSTQRRDGRWAPTTEIGRRSLRYRSRLAQGRDLANRSKQANAVLPTWSFSAPNAFDRMVFPAAHLPAMAARNPLQQDTRNKQHVRPLCPGSPPLGRAAGFGPLRLIGYPPIPSPAVFARLHPTLPDVLAASGSRTERYDGKGNLYFKHAA